MHEWTVYDPEFLFIGDVLEIVGDCSDVKRLPACDLTRDSSRREIRDGVQPF